MTESVLAYAVTEDGPSVIADGGVIQMLSLLTRHVLARHGNTGQIDTIHYPLRGPIYLDVIRHEASAIQCEAFLLRWRSGAVDEWISIVTPNQLDVLALCYRTREEATKATKSVLGPGNLCGWPLGESMNVLFKGAVWRGTAPDALFIHVQ